MNMAATADLIRHGASLLQEPCPRCGAVQIKFRGRTYCTREDDLNALISGEPPGQEKVPSPKQSKTELGQISSQTTPSPSETALRKMLEEKLERVTKQLDSTSDVDEQSRLLDLISKYLETLQKLKAPS
jgi:uncharacterized Zn finger protein (UPF0148 family)